jgi:hypothetical protein
VEVSRRIEFKIFTSSTVFSICLRMAIMDCLLYFKSTVSPFLPRAFFLRSPQCDFAFLLFFVGEIDTSNNCHHPDEMT